MNALLGFFGASPARLQALLIAALAMALVCAGLGGWALIERSGRYQAERDAAVYKSQSAVLSDSLDRCNAGVAAVQKAGEDAQKSVRELRAAAAKLNSASASLILDARQIVSRPAPLRPDGKARDCTDAWREIEARGSH